MTAAVRDAPFDLVFLDPPYDGRERVVAEVLAALAAAEAGHRRGHGRGGAGQGERSRVALPDGWGIE